MRQADKIGVLSEVPLFAGLSKKDLGHIARSVTVAEYGPRDYLVHEGGPGKEALVILDGSATVRRNGRKIAGLSAGDVVGEMSLVTDLPRNASVRADTFVNALVMSRAEFTKIMDENPKVAVKVLQTVATRLAENTRAV